MEKTVIRTYAGHKNGEAKGYNRIVKVGDWYRLEYYANDVDEPDFDGSGWKSLLGGFSSVDDAEKFICKKMWIKGWNIDIHDGDEY